METGMGQFVFGVATTLCALLVAGMLALGPDILEWIERTPEQG
jgi:hypothetical protein